MSQDTKNRITAKVSYFAILRDESGMSTETHETTASTAAELWEELNQKHKFSLPMQRLRVAIDSEFAEWDAPLHPTQSGQVQIAFIPPVAGG
ncbi:MAG: MoaD/ThiS family protein [Candidatus Melainabacteria bacterium]|jgi:molybdopterin synthase sulfur carrier subunit|nr:MoaD/ThiS family protein [Candidatus Melainabacteria bacterium]MBX9672873.1 MoaD/ThiS family protein [Candidatus Obscuribacterales bacterium]